MKNFEAEKIFIARIAKLETIDPITGEQGFVKSKLAVCGTFISFESAASSVLPTDEYMLAEINLFGTKMPDAVLNISMYNAKDRNAEHKTFTFKKISK